MNVNWTRRIFANGRGWHVGDMVHWNGAWHIAFCDGSGHNSPDTRLRGCSHPPTWRTGATGSPSRRRRQAGTSRNRSCSFPADSC